MTKVCIVSPHLDDGVFSNGDLISRESNVEVVTLFAGIPKETVKSKYDLKTGFNNSNEAVSARRNEDILATYHLGAAFIHLNFYDEQYGIPNSLSKMTKDLLQAIESADVVYAPLGLRHIDHVMTRDIIMHHFLKDLPDKQLYLYEELPYRIMEPEETVKTLNKLKKLHGIKLELQTPQTLTADKVFAVNRYISQMNTGYITPYTLLVPERHWRFYDKN